MIGEKIADPKEIHDALLQSLAELMHRELKVKLADLLEPCIDEAVDKALAEFSTRLSMHRNMATGGTDVTVKVERK